MNPSTSKSIPHSTHPSESQPLNPSSRTSLSTSKRKILESIDNAKFNSSHLKTIIISGVGFFTDAYDIFAINIASSMLGYVLNQDDHGRLDNQFELAIKIATPIGTFLGQILFGFLADYFGRSKVYGSELMIITISTLGQALSSSRFMVFWRFLLGIGIGGDYPLSACITSEAAAVKIRGRMMTAVFASQGFGQLTASIISLIVVKVFERSIKSDPIPGSSVENCWRLLIGFGAIPASCALYFRLTIGESQSESRRKDLERRDDEDDEDETDTINKDIESFSNSRSNSPKSPKHQSFWSHYKQWKHFKVLFGCAWSWFALDLAFYGLGLNSSIVLSAIGFGKSLDGNPNDQIYQSLMNVSIGNIVLSIAGLIPGYWVAFAFIDSWGRKPIQIMGFAALTSLFIIMGIAYHQLVDHSVHLFVFLYCLANFFQNFGPNTTTFVIPAECFVTRYRSRSHGISAASGKLGAILAQLGFTTLKDIGGKDQFIDKIFIIFSGFMFSGLLSSFLVPETMGKSLEELCEIFISFAFSQYLKRYCIYVFKDVVLFNF
ncbi:inorganic phosphate transporter [Melampsora larici-populina 98AG31]|uniref:Inorganic phosphate transporter n=1 Tax=Melampsora larici-populina (strain 98AG31 / pathotype 3-4-7) TaxID=747676 RepID=F4RY64_MELLP|nr:inorganic phosphate transporter [Melampsora larici-populina 98AG31]EGG02696.1 inorganic phosphate transporter [Melampsora larici-populina 98AG31]